MLTDQIEQFSRIENCRLLNNIILSENNILNQESMIDDLTNFVISSFAQ